jgi:hypothetical protein
MAVWRVAYLRTLQSRRAEDREERKAGPVNVPVAIVQPDGWPVVAFRVRQEDDEEEAGSPETRTAMSGPSGPGTGPKHWFPLFSVTCPSRSPGSSPASSPDPSVHSLGIEHEELPGGGRV